MKKVILIIVALVVIIFIYEVAKDLSNNPKGSGTDNADTVVIKEDVIQFSRISLSDLKNIMGEPVSEETWSNETSKGTVELTTYIYDKNSNHYEFIIADDSVVRLTIYSNSYWNNTGDRFETNDIKSEYSAYNIQLGDNAKVITNTGLVYTISPVNDKVAMFDIQDITDNTYGLVKVTYNLNYFE